jgi:HlyD family secretion protein
VDRELSHDTIRKARTKRVLQIVGAVLILSVAIMLLRSCISPTAVRSRLRLSVAEIGMIEATVSASGTVIPEFEQVITSPITTKLEKVLLKAGEQVHEGDAILQLNKESIQRTLAQLLDELELQKNRKKQLSLQLDRDKIDLQAAYDIKQLESEYKAAELAKVQHLERIGGATGEDVRRAELDLDIAKRALQQLISQMENQKSSLLADMRELDIQIRIQENRIGEVQTQVGLADARAERDGVVTWINDDIGASVHTGDVIARIADLSGFRVEATISDIHGEKLRVGGPVRVRLNDRYSSGHIQSIRPTVENGIITFVVELDEKSDPSLRHNLRVDVYVVTSYKDNVVRVRNGQFYRGKREQKVFVLNGDLAIGHLVDIGESNYDWVELIGDVAAGDTVIVSNMSRYKHMDEVSISND